MSLDKHINALDDAEQIELLKIRMMKIEDHMNILLLENAKLKFLIEEHSISL